MTYENETWHRWKKIAWTETVCDRWEVFFGSLLDQPTRAEALCALGLRIVHGDPLLCPECVSTPWMAFFGSLMGKPDETQKLCALGMKVVRAEAPPHDQATRSSVRSILHEPYLFALTGPPVTP